MTRVRKPTFKDSDRLIGGESIDTGVSHVNPSPQSLVTHTVFSQASTSPKTRKASSSLHHRIFSRSSAIPGQREQENDPSESTSGHQDVIFEETPSTSRKTMMKMTGWPFSRLPLRKNSRPTDTTLSPDVKNSGSDTQVSSHSPYYSVMSYAPTSTSSLGSLVPTHECLFHVASRDFTDEQTSTCRQYSDSSKVAAYPPSPRFSLVAITTPSDPMLPVNARGNHGMVERHWHQGQASSTPEPVTQTSSFELAPEEEMYSWRSIAATTEPGVPDEDHRPPTETLGPLVTMSLPAPAIIAATQKRGRRVQCLNIDVLTLRPAVGATPHPPSETESFSTSAYSTSASSPSTSPIARDSFPAAFPVMKPSDTDAGTFSSPPRVLHSNTPPNPRVLAVSPDDGSSCSNSNPNCSPDTTESSASVVASPRSRKRAISRSLTPPPLPRPPPKGPLPAVPSPSVPPVPPLPPLLNKLSMMNVNTLPHTIIPSPPRSSTMTGAAATAALPPSPPGALRLPSRLSWVNSVRAVLPSPPASPTKKAKTLSGGDKPSSSSKVEKKQSSELERRPRPMSVSVIEATEDFNGDNGVRRTKSILLLGSRSKSNMSLGTKRVQIHADVDGDSDVGGDGVGARAPSDSTAAANGLALVSAPASVTMSSRKQKRKSDSAAAALGLGLGLGHPTVFSGPFPRVPSLSVPMPMTNSRREEVVVFPLERRHSAPLLSTFDPKVSADWTLSLPFSTDVPGNKILLPSSSEPQLKKEKEEEDWTLCMPLKLRAIDVPIRQLCDGVGEEGMSVVNSEMVTGEEEEESTATHLPTPSPSPTWPMPRSGVVSLDPTENEEQEEEEVKEEKRSEFSAIEPEDRPASPTSTLGPHAGGLDLAGGCGKRASGWHVYGWFDEVNVDTGIAGSVAAAVSQGRLIKSHVSVFRKNDANSGVRHPSQDSILSSAASTSDTVFYSARSSWLTN